MAGDISILFPDTWSIRVHSGPTLFTSGGMIRKKRTNPVLSGNKAAIMIQSPEGKDITPKQIRKPVPEGTDYVFVRVEENGLYWVKGSESGAADIW